MIKSYSLFTSEVDVITQAVEDIQKQLSEIKLLTNSVGIIFCHYDHISSGITSALAQVLPFPLVGCTTFYQTTPKTEGLFELTITVLTSDDVSFGIGLSVSEQPTPSERVLHAFNEAVGGHSEKPALLMTFLTAKRSVTGDEFVRQMDLASGGIPNFGTVASGDKDDGESIFLLHGKKAYNEGFAVVAFFGEITTNFYMGNIKEENLLEQNALVTKSEGIVLQELNNLPATTFIERNGVILDNNAKAGLLTIPFLLKYKGTQADAGTLISRTMYDFNSKGEAFFFGEIPEGLYLHLVTMTTDDILSVTKHICELAASQNPDASIFFVFSCVGRYMALGMDTASEFSYIKEIFKNSANYLATYASGEICPIKTSGNFTNIYHNYSIIICAIK